MVLCGFGGIDPFHQSCQMYVCGVACSVFLLTFKCLWSVQLRAPLYSNWSCVFPLSVSLSFPPSFLPFPIWLQFYPFIDFFKTLVSFFSVFKAIVFHCSIIIPFLLIILGLLLFSVVLRYKLAFFNSPHFFLPPINF